MIVPPQSPKHGGTLDLLVGLLQPHLGPHEFIREQRPISLPPDSEPEPDLAWVRGERTKFLARHPGPEDVKLLVEIAATSLATDLEQKVPLYARHGIAELWVVDLATGDILQFAEPDGTHPGRYGRERRVAPDMRTLDALTFALTVSLDTLRVASTRSP